MRSEPRIRYTIVPDEGTRQARSGGAGMADPRGLRAAYVFCAPRAPVRRGTRRGDWALLPLPAEDVEVQREAIRRIRSRAHAELWGGQATAELEVVPPGATDTPWYAMQPGNWVANVGDDTAYIQLRPPTSRHPLPLWLAEIPPQHKAILLADTGIPTPSGDVSPLLVRRATEGPWLRDADLWRPNVDTSTLVWRADQAAAPVKESETPDARHRMPRFGSINVAGTVGGVAARSRQRLAELADCAEFHQLGILFCIGCGPRQDIRELQGRPWQVRWSGAGGSPQEGVCALIHTAVSISGVRSEHHNVLAVQVPLTNEQRGRRLPDLLTAGAYLPPPTEEEPGRWREVLTALRRGPKVLCGDWNVRDPAHFYVASEVRRGGRDDAFSQWLDELGLAVAPVAEEMPTWLGAGAGGAVHATRIDHVLHDAAAEGWDI
eukprot:gene13371-14452_t